MERLNLIGEYDDTQINLDGTVESLHDFASALRQAVSEHTYTLFIPDQPTSWYGYLDCIKIRLVHDTQVTITREADCLTLSGDRAGLDKIAHAVDFVANSPQKGHIHIEYPAWSIISSDSDALIISCVE